MFGNMLAMDLRPSLPFPEPPFPEPGGDQVVVLHGVSWDQYVALSNARTSSRPLMAYLDGELEIVSTSREHEIDKKLIARFVEAYADAASVSLNAIGNATFRKKAKSAGVEPDECYCVGPMKKFPTLAIEVVYTSGGVDKLEIYRRLGVTEVWFWIERRFWIYRLVGKTYEPQNKSGEMPRLDLDRLTRAIHATEESGQTEAVRAYRNSLRRRR